MTITKIYPNGWYRILGAPLTVHYFFNDKPIHKVKYGQFETSYLKIYVYGEGRQCKRCKAILKAYRSIGLENRLHD